MKDTETYLSMKHSSFVKVHGSDYRFPSMNTSFFNFISTDIDECADLQFNITCPDNAHCNNVPGTYNCVCNEGYKNDSNICQGT